MSKFLFHMTKDNFADKYKYVISQNESMFFCGHILNLLGIPKNSCPFAISFYTGSTFTLQKVCKNEWVKEKHRLDNAYCETEVMIERFSVKYYLNDNPLITMPVGFDRIFQKFGNTIHFDCYYYEL